MKSLALCPAAGLAALGSVCSNTPAQPVVGPNIPVSTIVCPACLPGTIPLNGEPVIVASTLNADEVLVAWMFQPPGINLNNFRIHYRVSTTGFLGPLPPGPSILPVPNAHPGGCTLCAALGAGDPAATRSRVTGDLFLGATFNATPQGGIRSLGIARKPLGATDLERFPGTITWG